MPSLEGNTDFAVSFEAADAWPVPGAWIDDNKGSTGCIRSKVRPSATSSVS